MKQTAFSYDETEFLSVDHTVMKVERNKTIMLKVLLIMVLISIVFILFGFIYEVFFLVPMLLLFPAIFIGSIYLHQCLVPYGVREYDIKNKEQVIDALFTKELVGYFEKSKYKVIRKEEELIFYWEFPFVLSLLSFYEYFVINFKVDDNKVRIYYYYLINNPILYHFFGYLPWHHPLSDSWNILPEEIQQYVERNITSSRTLMTKLICPRCDSTFHWNHDSLLIKCPNCGVAGNLGD